MLKKKKRVNVDGCRWRPGIDSFWHPWLFPADTLLETSISPQENRYMKLSLVAVSL